MPEAPRGWFFRLRLAVLALILLGVVLYAAKDYLERRSRNDWDRTLRVAVVVLELEPVPASALDTMRAPARARSSPRRGAPPLPHRHGCSPGDRFRALWSRGSSASSTRTEERELHRSVAPLVWALALCLRRGSRARARFVALRFARLRRGSASRGGRCPHGRGDESAEWPRRNGECRARRRHGRSRPLRRDTRALPHARRDGQVRPRRARCSSRAASWNPRRTRSILNASRRSWRAIAPSAPPKKWSPTPR